MNEEARNKSLAFLGSLIALIAVVWVIVVINGRPTDENHLDFDMLREHVAGVERVNRLTEHPRNRAIMDSLATEQMKLDFVLLDIVANEPGPNTDLVQELRRRGYWIPDDFVRR